MWIVTTLLKIINNSEIKSIEYQIAYKILENTMHIKDMNIQDLAEVCNVSVNSLNKFLRIFGFHNFRIFKSLFVSHIDMRLGQIKMRIRYKDIEKENATLKSFLSDEDYAMVTDEKKFKEICEKIHGSNRVMLVGSDEMKTLALRFEGDLIALGKFVMKNTLYDGLFVEPTKEDVVFVFSMTGRTILMNKTTVDTLDKAKKNTIVVGHDNYLESGQLLYIPKGLSPIFEDFILNYYLERIIYHYMELYYDL